MNKPMASPPSQPPDSGPTPQGLEPSDLNPPSLEHVPSLSAPVATGTARAVRPQAIDFWGDAPMEGTSDDCGGRDESSSAALGFKLSGLLVDRDLGDPRGVMGDVSAQDGTQFMSVQEHYDHGGAKLANPRTTAVQENQSIGGVEPTNLNDGLPAEPASALSGHRSGRRFMTGLLAPETDLARLLRQSENARFPALDVKIDLVPTDNMAPQVERKIWPTENQALPEFDPTILRPSDKPSKIRKQEARLKGTGISTPRTQLKALCHQNDFLEARYTWDNQNDGRLDKLAGSLNISGSPFQVRMDGVVLTNSDGLNLRCEPRRFANHSLAKDFLAGQVLPDLRKFLGDMTRSAKTKAPKTKASMAFLRQPVEPLQSRTNIIQQATEFNWVGKLLERYAKDDGNPQFEFEEASPGLGPFRGVVHLPRKSLIEPNIHFRTVQGYSTKKQAKQEAAKLAVEWLHVNKSNDISEQKSREIYPKQVAELSVKLGLTPPIYDFKVQQRPNMPPMVSGGARFTVYELFGPGAPSLRGLVGEVHGVRSQHEAKLLCAEKLLDVLTLVKGMRLSVLDGNCPQPSMSRPAAVQAISATESGSAPTNVPSRPDKVFIKLESPSESRSILYNAEACNSRKRKERETGGPQSSGANKLELSNKRRLVSSIVLPDREPQLSSQAEDSLQAMFKDINAMRLKGREPKPARSRGLGSGPRASNDRPVLSRAPQSSNRLVTPQWLNSAARPAPRPLYEREHNPDVKDERRSTDRYRPQYGDPSPMDYWNRREDDESGRRR